MVVGAKAQVLIDAVRINNLAGIHLPVRVPDGLEFAEGFDQFLPEHFVEELSFGLAVAMFAAEAAAVLDAEIGGFLHE